MLVIPCPYCGPRPELEFRHAGEAHIARPADPSVTEAGAWAEYLYVRSNPKGRHIERWRHASGCHRFFNCVRDTVTDVIEATYPAGEARR